MTLIITILTRYMEKDYGFLFDEQVISYTAQSREFANALIVAATRRAIQMAQHKQQQQEQQQEQPPPPAPTKAAANEDAAVIHADQSNVLVDTFKEALLSKYGSSEKAFHSMNKKGVVSKKEWKKALMRLMPDVTVAQMKSLRKQLPKKVQLEAFVAFVDGAGAVKSGSKSVGDQQSSEKSRAGLADLPNEVPEIPSSFMHRPHAQQQLLLALIDSASTRSTAVTAPKSKIASQGSE